MTMQHPRTNTPQAQPTQAQPTHAEPTIHVIRHAQGFHNIDPSCTVRDPYLTTLGLEQCATVQRNYRHIIPSVDAILCSPLRRTIMTALLCFAPAIVEGGKIPVLRPELQEVGPHVFNTGSPLEELVKEFGGAINVEGLPPNWFQTTEGQSEDESLLLRRATSARNTIRLHARHQMVTNPQDCHIVVVSHADFIPYLVDDFASEFYENVEIRSYKFQHGVFSEEGSAGLVETADSKARRGFDKGNGPSQSLKVSINIPILRNLPMPPPSNRLTFRPLFLSDLEAYHSLRRQPEVVRNGCLTEPDKDLEETRKYYERTEKPRDVRLGIFLKGLEGHEGELIGEGGVVVIPDEWPQPYYMFKKEHWGKGYATEFLKAFLTYWFGLPTRKAWNLQKLRRIKRDIVLESKLTEEKKLRLRVFL
ncbi:GNAT domain-containing protein [Hypomontagnella submonticulosa]|nr:GNAT domain-containing protein [Hypomontagnella submonticulosa]